MKNKKWSEVKEEVRKEQENKDSRKEIKRYDIADLKLIIQKWRALPRVSMPVKKQALQLLCQAHALKGKN